MKTVIYNFKYVTYNKNTRKTTFILFGIAKCVLICERQVYSL